MKSAKDPPQLNFKQTPQAGNGKEAKLETGDRSNQNDPAEEKNNQKVVPKSSEEPGQTKPVSEISMANEGEAKPELASQITEASESSKNDLSEEKKNCLVLEVSFSTGIL